MLTDQPIEAELAGGGQAFYGLVAESEYRITVVVEQQGIDVVVTVLGPDGELVKEIDSPNGSHGPEELVFTPPLAGQHRIRVQALED